MKFVENKAKFEIPKKALESFISNLEHEWDV